MAHSNDTHQRDDETINDTEEKIVSDDSLGDKEVTDKESDSAKGDVAFPEAAEEKGERPSEPEDSGDSSEPHGRFAFLRTVKGKVILGIIGLALILGIVCALPATRYPLFGLVIRHDVSVLVVDSVTAKPVSNAQVIVGKKSALTNAEGKAQLKKVPAGRYSATAQKKYYTPLTQQVTIGFKRPGEIRFNLAATGRQVQLKVLNKLTKKPINKAYITVLDTNATTDEKGEATIVVPAGKLTEKAKVTKEGFHDLQADIQVVEQVDERNTLPMVPSGTIAYLSKRTGTINVMKANLDGSDAKVLLQGTGKEDSSDTSLLASRDWRYAVLKAKRDSDQAKLYLINIGTGAVSTIDEGNAIFTPVGWYNEYFVYEVYRSSVQDWQPKREALKSFNARTNQLATLDETAGEGAPGVYYYETLEKPYILDNLVAYTKVWFGTNKIAGKRSAIMSVKPSGQDKKVVKDFDAVATNNIDAKLYKPQEIYFGVYDSAAKPTFYEFDKGTLETATDMTDTRFYGTTYNTYLLSPSGQKTLWYESRDGKNVVFTGDSNGEQPKEVSSSDDFAAYGWYGEDYLLLSKKSSELYILPFADAASTTPFKVTDYHKPATNFSGYGYGYGGF